LSNHDADIPEQRERWEHTHWNFFWLVTESSAFQTGMKWVDPAAVLPLFISHLTPSTVVLGLATVSMRLGWIVPQLPMAAIVGHRPRRAPYLRWGVFFGRIPLLAFVVYLWLHGLQQPNITLWFMLIAYTFVALGNGVVAVPLQDITAKSIPPRLRGRFFGSIMLATAVTALGVGYAVRWILGPAGPGLPRDYTILFTLMAVFLSISTLGCGMAREPVRPALDAAETIRGLVTAALRMLKTKPEFRLLVLVALLGSGLSVSTPFYMVYATRDLGVPAEMAGIYIWAATLGVASFSMIWGHLNDRRGPRAVLRGAAGLLCLAPLLALALPLAAEALASALPGARRALPLTFSSVFLAAGSTMGAFRMGVTNYLFELSSHEERPRYIAIVGTLSGPGALIPLLIGWALTLLPFRTVFSGMALAGALLAATAWRMRDLKS
jgi:MFS family permease